MRSVSTEPTPGEPVSEPQSTGDGDLTARARIRDAAVELFAADGVEKTTVRAIAAAADVSPGLIIHHFGSKQRLREECDRYIASCLREQKTEAMRSGPGLDPLAAMRASGDGPPIMRYLARTLTESTPEVADMVDTIVRDAAGYMEEGVRNGLLTPTDRPYERAAVLSLYSLGMLTLHTHVERLLGVDLFGEPAELRPYLEAASEIVISGVGTELLEAMVSRAFTEEGNTHE